jgi:monoamine oxidase
VARTPLVASLRRAFRLAALAARRRPGTPPLDELVEIAYSRRTFIRDSALASAAMIAAAGCRQADQPAPAQAPAAPGVQGPQAPRIAIVGGGIAGLNAAYRLRQAGLTATIFEGASRTGGRMFTASNLLADGLTTELGGEFIDSTHEEMLALMDEFTLERLDTLGDEAGKLRPETYFIDGRHYTQAQAARAFVPIAARILEDYDSMEDVVDYQNEGGGGAIDRLSIAAYLDRVEASGWMRQLLESAYVTEYGLDAGEQSALNFLFLIGTGDLEDESVCALLGESDERYKVRGGNQQIVDELARRVEPQIRRLHRLEALRANGRGFTLTFQADGKAVDDAADVVILAIPFTMLREVNLQVELPPIKQRVIRELGYGANAKVLVGFRSRLWEKQGYAGNTYTDETFQLAWANSYLQAGAAGGLTLYSGGTLAHEAGKGTAEEAVKRLLPGVERAYPGVTRDQNGRVSRFHWPTHPWTKASYSCYTPGQWTTLAGSESVPVGNLFFAGEHCSYDFQGYMNGAAQSGADTARAVMAAVSSARAFQPYSRRAVLAARVGRRRAAMA